MFKIPSELQSESTSDVSYEIHIYALCICSLCKRQSNKMNNLVRHYELVPDMKRLFAFFMCENQSALFSQVCSAAMSQTHYNSLVLHVLCNNQIIKGVCLLLPTQIIKRKQTQKG